MIILFRFENIYFHIGINHIQDENKQFQNLFKTRINTFQLKLNK